jgi:hypothetical protein
MEPTPWIVLNVMMALKTREHGKTSLLLEIITLRQLAVADAMIVAECPIVLPSFYLQDLQHTHQCLACS